MTLLPPAKLSMNQRQNFSARVSGFNQLPQWRTNNGLQKMDAPNIPTVPTSPGIGECTASAASNSLKIVPPFRNSQGRKLTLLENPVPCRGVRGTTDKL